MNVALRNVVNLESQIQQSLVVFGKPEPLGDFHRRNFGGAVRCVPKLFRKLFAVLGVLGHPVLIVDFLAGLADGLKNVFPEPLGEFHTRIQPRVAGYGWSISRSELERIEKRGLEVRG